MFAQLLTVLFVLFVLALIATFIGSLVSWIVSFWTPAYPWWPTWQPRLRNGWIGLFLSGLLLCVIVVGAVAYVYVPPMSLTAPHPASDPLDPPASSDPQPLDKCSWLAANVPQGGDGVELQNFAAKLLSVPTARIRVHIYPCGDGKTVYDGFIVLGPREGNWTSMVTATVPDHGAIDSYNTAKFSQTPTRIGQNTLRATSGTVTATTMTYWFWLDENPPVSNTTSAASAEYTASTCIDPTKLADQHGWSYTGSPDQYGGLVVTLSGPDTLPNDWEAVTDGRVIRESDKDRAMKAGVYTVYPPFACREELHYSK